MKKADRTKDFIIQKTAPLFNTRGFSGTSLNDMTEATGLTKGSIYANFKNKDEVALAVFDYNWRLLSKLISKAMERKQTVMDKLMVYPSVYEQILKDPILRSGCPILNTATESDDTHPQLRREAAAAIVSWRNGLASLIQRGIDAGELNESLTAADTAFTIIALIEGSIMISKLTGKPADRKRTRLTLENYILNLRKI